MTAAAKERAPRFALIESILYTCSASGCEADSEIVLIDRRGDVASELVEAGIKTAFCPVHAKAFRATMDRNADPRAH